MTRNMKFGPVMQLGCTTLI